MAKVSPIVRSFNAGEFSKLMDGRSDIDRYPSSMRKLLNYVAAPQGPAIGRSGTMYVTPVHSETSKTILVPFVFSEVQAFVLEFSNNIMRVILRDGPLLDGGVPYTLTTPYNQDQLADLRFVQSGDVVYILRSGANVYKLQRLGATNWTITPVIFADGPFGPINNTTTRLRPDDTGQLTVTPVETSIGNQTRTVEYTPSGPSALTGYYIAATGPNDDPTFTSLDRAPATWTLEGFNSGVWSILDQKSNHVLYDNKRTPFFRVADSTLYDKFRVAVTEVRRNGAVTPAFDVFFGAVNAPFNILATGTAGINNGLGFQPTDVGRLIRYHSISNAVWSTLRIDAVGSTTGIVVTSIGTPIGDTIGTSEWRLGYWSATTGFPTTAVFYEDRLWFGGSTAFPDLIVGSVTGSYESMAQTDDSGVVADDNAVSFTLNSRRISRISWLSTDERGLLIGTGSGEWVMTGGDRDAPITARSIKVRNSTQRGSAVVEPVKVDRQILFVQRSGRSIREMTYVYEADGYKSPSMSLFSSHIASTARFVEMDYAAEPHSIVWFRRDDGTIAGLTYNRDENVIGWHQHDFAGGFVESIAVVPTIEAEQDTLWLVVRRVINGVTRRYVERMTKTWDFTTTLADVHLVDCALRYVGAAATSISGLTHLEGKLVAGLADGSPFTATVSGGIVTLATAASNVLIGLPFDAIGVTNRLEAGAADGTSQGKTKRIHKAIVRTLQSVGGAIGRSETELEEINSRRPDDNSGALPLRDEDVLVEWPSGYDGDATIAFKRSGLVPLPFNIIAVMPQLVTQDGG